MSNALYEVPPQQRAVEGTQAVTAGFPLPSAAGSRGWIANYRTRVIVTDVAMIGIATGTPLVILKLWDEQHARVPFLAVACLVWVVALAVFDSRGSRALGTGTFEYKRVVDASLTALGAVALLAFVFGTTVRPQDVFPSLPLGLVLLLIGRWGWRQWLRSKRAQGLYLNKAVLVGSTTTIAHAKNQLDRHPDSGYAVVDVIVPDLGESAEEGDLLDRLVDSLTRHDGDTVMLTSSDAMTPQRIRGLAWDLERHDYRLVVTPSLTDVAESRIQTQPVAGLPLIHILSPTYTGPQRIAKRFFDIVGSGLLLIALSPIMGTVALLVATTSRGPVLYLQERVGRGNRPFSIFKFRSMQIDADARLADLLAQQGTSDTPLFKIQKDPRLTSVGATLRRFSVDELPQLFNVLRGDMSLVGPRPQRPAEVALYDSAAHRRLKVRPGMTGLWQVSGRSRLSWEEALRLDLYYIENWTLMVDVIIMWRTFRAVVGSDGAY
ncbi:sugar transferase [Frondihabitans australicus]|uniref:Undecaprenyl-phosphate galactose phosphotransferase WbaP/exopolysaccharide biosynthesis polyprenyl glycosylphosphotransferase n=1 Tax=Frondihabitans australicus TaxID=386892 RepID=A0A495IC24_9MICO|nr:sugar transferase [Frondihabitans australicus]RKR73547.1 Undecaprenyl-phosphate galactose phosphotransferase WbaP/exopolysaccharide biosynthesis polyprenyl glycosylphosphotransferase [Frondihabitans australicus]